MCATIIVGKRILAFQESKMSAPKMALFIGCAVYTLPVQPLANVVGNYTCSNR